MAFNRSITPSVAALIVALAAAGCASAEPNSSASTPASSALSTQATETPARAPIESATPSPTEEKECLGEMRVGIISRGWELVVASQGAGDHAEMVESFNDSVHDAFESNEDSVGRCRGNVELADLQYQSQLLETYVVIQGEAEEEFYTNVVDAGNAWFQAIKRNDYQMLES